DSGTELFLPEGPLDFGNKSGRLLGTIRAAIAGLERTEILERVWAAKEAKRRAGGFAQSRVCLPYGVNYDGAVWSYTAESERVREAFRLLLAGELSYRELGRKVGIEATNLRVILRNEIYAGWRVIDKQRDTSASARRTRADGRQGDRPKITRAAEDIIRLKVINVPLISEERLYLAYSLVCIRPMTAVADIVATNRLDRFWTVPPRTRIHEARGSNPLSSTNDIGSGSNKPLSFFVHPSRHSGR
ncbi:MAG: recombinase family protein, partial [Blastocatellia bacterium]